MQFLFLLMVNVILWVVFYLVISLKLERSASEFREKRLRREMDAVIKEFNETAERNISLLENRITVMKRLMKQGGIVKNLDMNVGDDVVSLPAADTAKPCREEPRVAPAAERSVPSAGVAVRNDMTRLLRGASDMVRAYVGKGALFLLERIAGKAEVSSPERDERANREVQAPAAVGAPVAGSIRKDLSEFADAVTDPSLGADRFNETDIAGLFGESNDKYALISDLYGKGCPVELISRCSGIPAGEIRLVLNLHAKQ